MKLTYAAQATAKAKADALHAWLIANNIRYGASVTAGQTNCWAIPYQERDRLGNIIDTNWAVTVKEKCRGAMSAAELLAAGM